MSGLFYHLHAKTLPLELGGGIVLSRIIMTHDIIICYRLKVTRDVPAITILLSKEHLDENIPG